MASKEEAEQKADKYLQVLMKIFIILGILELLDRAATIVLWFFNLIYNL